MKKPSDAIAWLWNNTLGQWLLLVAVALVVLFALLQIWILDSAPDLYNKLDLTLKIIGGLLLFFGLVIAAWRSMIAERQASSMARQASSMERQVSSMESQVSSMAKGQYSERFAKAVEQIASDQLAIRLGGLASIEALSKETEGEFIRVWTYLGEFLRYPPELAQWRDESAGKEYLGRRPDIAAVAAMLRSSDKTRLRWAKENQLPLNNAKLQGARLINADLYGADLQNAQLTNAELQGADLLFANLQGAKLQDANLQGANLQSAELQGAELLGISLHKRGIQQLFSKGSGVLLKDAFFSLDLLKEAVHIKDLVPEKMSDIYYNDSDGPLPDDWPGDYKPQSIAYAEWLIKRK